MTELEQFQKQLSGFLISTQVLAYGGLGLVSALIIHFTFGFAVQHPLLLVLGILFWILFSSSMAWVFWEFVLPVAGGKPRNERN